MLKYVIIVSLVVTLVFSDDASKSANPVSIPTQLNSTQHQKSEISKVTNATISENINKNVIEEAKNVGKGTAQLLNKQKEEEEPVVSESFMDDVDDGEDFKYYWVLLVFSSLSIISIIVFKSFR